MTLAPKIAMRLGYRDAGFIDDFGLSFGWDFTAEHEWGIKDLQYDFGITPDELGIEGRRIRKTPDHLKWFDAPLQGIIQYPSYDDTPERMTSLHNTELTTAWSSSDFGVANSVSDDRPRLRAIYDALVNQDALFTLANYNQQNPFSRSCFHILIVSKLPADVADQMMSADLEYRQLQEDHDATGIDQLLTAAGKSWYALRPERADDGTLRWWLNPRLQDKYNSRWCSLDDLKDWAEDRGPVMKGSK